MVCHGCPTVIRVLLRVLPLLCLFAMFCAAGCATRAAGGGAVAPPWRLEWVSPPGGMSAAIPVEAAFARGARLLHSTDTLSLNPSTTTWLATSPTFGVA